MIRSTISVAIALVAFAAQSTTAGAQVVTTRPYSTPKQGPVEQVAPAPMLSANPPSTELLHSSTVRLLQSDYDTQLLRLPPDSRLGFGTDVDRINALLRTILVDKTLADEARKSGVAAEPDVTARVAAETDRILAQAMMDRSEAQWNTEFDARPNMEQAARERWLAQPDKFKRAEEVKFTQVFYASSKHDDAQAMAQAARDKAAKGADLAALAKAESDEPNAAENGGRVDWTPTPKIDRRLARHVAALKHAGDVSEPIRTPQGYFVIRLDDRRGGEVRPFDEVKDEIIREMRKAYVDEKRTQRMASIRNDPSIVVNQPAVDALLVRIDPEVLKRARESGHATPPAAAK